VLSRLKLENFTAFQTANFKFAPQMNVLIGENSAGKTHVLKLAYCICAVHWEEGRKSKEPTKALLQSRLADKLVGVFRPEALGRLARRRQGRERCDVAADFSDQAFDVSFDFATNSKSEVQIGKLPSAFLGTAPVYLPTRELLTIYPNFVSFYEGHYLEFEETWRDTCVLLGAPLQKGPKAAKTQEVLHPLEQALGGTVELDQNGRFYLRTVDGRMEITLVAEGLRKLAMLARLVATGTLLDKGYLFWDEPEANLNPRLVKFVVRTLLELSRRGVQIFLATHSLFVLRELQILLSKEKENPRNTAFFGLHRCDSGVRVETGTDPDDIGDIAALNEELAQADRLLELND